MVTLNKLGIPHYSIPNEGKRSIIESARLKRLGMQSGIPDLCIPVPRAPYHGLYIEMKPADGGNVMDSQKYWRDVLLRQGYQSVISNGFDEAWAVVAKYFGGNYKC